MTQTERILAALRRGPVNSTAFMLPDVYDGGRPITRVGARIYDLRQNGCEISERREANGTSTYTLVSELDAERSGGTTAAELGLLASPTAAPLGALSRPAYGDALLSSPEATLFEWPAVAA